MNIELTVRYSEWDKFVDLILRTTPLFCECGGLSPLGIPLYEAIGDQLVQTGVICNQCNDNLYKIPPLRDLMNGSTQETD